MEWVSHIPLAIMALLWVLFMAYSIVGVAQMNKRFRQIEEEDERNRKKGHVDSSRWWG